MDLLLCISPSLKPYLVSSPTTIRNWVKEEYLKTSLLLKSLLANSNSRIHLSFDIWTSPSSAAFISVCAHFLGKNLRLHYSLIAIREISDFYNGEAITEVIKTIISY